MFNIFKISFIQDCAIIRIRDEVIMFDYSKSRLSFFKTTKLKTLDIPKLKEDLLRTKGIVEHELKLLEVLEEEKNGSTKR